MSAGPGILLTGGSGRFGSDRGLLIVPDDFDAPLPDAIVDEFER